MKKQSNPRLEIRGAIRAGTITFDRAALAALPATAQVPDVGVLVRGKKGRGVRLATLVAKAGPTEQARYLDILSSDPAFAISVPLEEVLEDGIVVYEQNGSALAPENGGPFRLLVSGHADECVNVKSIVKLVLSEVRGRDTRPKDDEEHRKLHAKSKAKSSPKGT
jgi:DMSO/TMAO reductase YedYZ molybdopterin-dependent catalytic subunit